MKAYASRRAPVQADHRPAAHPRPAGTVPWAVHAEAWEFYATLYGTEQSAFRIADRGGFGSREMQCMLAKMRRHDETTPLPDLPGWEPR